MCLTPGDDPIVVVVSSFCLSLNLSSSLSLCLLLSLSPSFCSRSFAISSLSVFRRSYRFLLFVAEGGAVPVLEELRARLVGSSSAGVGRTTWESSSISSSLSSFFPSSSSSLSSASSSEPPGRMGLPPSWESCDSCTSSSSSSPWPVFRPSVNLAFSTIALLVVEFLPATFSSLSRNTRHGLCVLSFLLSSNEWSMISSMHFSNTLSAMAGRSRAIRLFMPSRKERLLGKSVTASLKPLPSSANSVCCSCICFCCCVFMGNVLPMAVANAAYSFKAAERCF
mmetsp:Transcript_22652/g.89616  ORF Transcript_22652/g.89616 Transcript_22652/m.89616 type:complete len:281 (+) Transcript_22652:81-923(+)